MNNMTTNKGKQSQKVSLTAKVLLVLPSFSSILLCVRGEDNVSRGCLGAEQPPHPPTPHHPPHRQFPKGTPNHGNFDY